jgi:AcrR family transcriptional regulator
MGQSPSSRRKEPAARTARGDETRRRLIDAAMHEFATRGFRGTRLEDIASEVGITKAALLRHFGSKDELFFEVHRTAVLGLPAYLDAPPEIVERGFFAVFRYWLEHTDHLMREDFDRYRVELLGRYSTELELQGRISRFWLTEDPEKTVDFVDFGKARGEVRADLDPYLVAALLDWVEDGLQRSMAAEELDRGLFHREDDAQQRRQSAIDTIMDLLQRALAPDSGDRSEA